MVKLQKMIVLMMALLAGWLAMWSPVSGMDAGRSPVITPTVMSPIATPTEGWFPTPAAGTPYPTAIRLREFGAR